MFTGRVCVPTTDAWPKKCPQKVTCLYVRMYACTDLTDEQKEYQQLARKFGREVVKPAAAEYDRTGEVSGRVM